ncbi:MAG: homoprotocatechuate degradation operon regulator HpaR [Conchiformibius sp.]|nr:homoprotocatechuate degradation operon regulator HpaR [Conchiformibius sp.]
MPQTPLSPSSISIALAQARETVLSYFRPVLNEAGLTEQQWRVIHTLSGNDSVDFQELAIKTCILRPSLTGMLTRMEQAGWVVRLKPAKDQRRVFIKLSNQGKRLFEQTQGKIAACQQQLEQDLGDENLKSLHTLLDRLNSLNTKQET